MYRRKDFLTLLLSDSNRVSIKRFATFLALIHFFLLSFIAIFIKRDFFNQYLLTLIIDVDKFIIGIGLGVITAQNIGQLIVSKLKTNQDDSTQAPVEQVPPDPK